MIPTESTVINIKESVSKLFQEWMHSNIKSGREKGLTFTQIFILHYLQEKNNAEITSIAKFLGVSKPAVTGIIDTLERNSYVKRVRNADDRRKIEIQLTERANELIESFERKNNLLVEALIRSIPENCFKQFIENTNILISKIGKTHDFEIL